MSLLLSLTVTVSATPNMNKAMNQKVMEKNTKSQHVNGKVKLDGQTLRNAMLLVETKGQAKKVQTVFTNSLGEFNANIADGTYSVKAVKDQHNWYNTNETFSVESGKVSGLKEGEMKLSKKSKMNQPKGKIENNFTGTLFEGSKGLKADLIIAKFTEEYEEEFFLVSSKNNGQFSASLSDGNYYVWGLLEDGGFYRYELTFSIDGRDLYVGGSKESSLTLNIPEKLYTGTVKDETKGIAGMELILERVIDEDYYDFEFIQYMRTNNKGQFSIRELQDGEYSLSVMDSSFFAWDYSRFTVVDGKITSSLDLKIPNLSLLGTVVDGKKALNFGYVEVAQLDENGEYIDMFGIPVDGKGNFSSRLPDGNYVVAYVDEFYRFTKVDVPFEIRNGKMLQNNKAVKSIQVSLPKLTFFGTLVEGEKQFQGTVEIVKRDEETYDWYYAHTDEKGIYSFRLLDGEYEVVGAYLDEEHDYVQVSYPFEIKDGKLFVDGVQKELFELQVPPVTLHGVLKEGDSLFIGGELGIISLDHGHYFWKWVQEDGTFQMRLADGHYKVVDLYTWDGSNGYVNLEFEIRNGQLYVNDVLTDILEVQVPPVTLFGKIMSEGIALQGEVAVRSLSDENYFHLWSWTNDEDTFTFRLPDGDYEVFYVYLYDGTSFVSGKQFSIQDGSLYVDGLQQELLEVEVLPVTLSGTVYNNGKVVREGYVTIVSLDEDGEWQGWYDGWIEFDGTYKFRLVDGSYSLLFVENFRETSFFDLEFTIENGKVYINGELVETLDLEMQDGNIQP